MGFARENIRGHCAKWDRQLVEIIPGLQDNLGAETVQQLLYLLPGLQADGQLDNEVLELKVEQLAIITSLVVEVQKFAFWRVIENLIPVNRSDNQLQIFGRI